MGIAPAVLKPGVAGIPEDNSRPVSAGLDGAPIRGRALVFWDPILPGTSYRRKLDAIDTDQITPARDCVSESLDRLDERWKAGAFRYLMPDFRARVHRGESFLIAGDRFGIGSSREMSPAGLKAIADEAGLQMVIVCGDNMGDIFRRNALNIGLHVVQSRAAVNDADDGDELMLDPQTRTLTNLTKGKVYERQPKRPSARPAASSPSDGGSSRRPCEPRRWSISPTTRWPGR
jgi:3-isopropylmalate dehydratase small subunit